MNTRLLASIALFLTLLGTQPALAADAALDAFVAQVLERNPSLKARGFERESVLREASATGLYPDPEVAIMLDRVPERMGSSTEWKQRVAPLPPGWLEPRQRMTERTLELDDASWLEAAGPFSQRQLGDGAQIVEIGHTSRRQSLAAAQYDLLRYPALSARDLDREHPIQVVIGTAAR